jgi:tripartite-type tricarboxylate transporter receptor subunit TctC
MKIRFHVTACLLAVAIIGAGTESDVLAQSFPSRRITLTVPFRAGSATRRRDQASGGEHPRSSWRHGIGGE